MSTQVLYIDIDGTLIVPGAAFVPERTRKYLEELHYRGWQIVFITARTPAWAFPLFEEWNIPFYLAVFNGALVYKMPGKIVLHTALLDPSIKEIVLDASREEDTALAYYSSQQTILFQKNASKPLKDHLLRRNRLFQEDWHEDTGTDQENALIAIRCFGREDAINNVRESLKNNALIHAPKMYDSSQNGFFLVQVTDAAASKQAVFLYMQKKIGAEFSIGCGDDYNDLCFLKEVDIAIVMETSPLEIQSIGHVIASSAEKEGLIVALDTVIQKKRVE